MASCSSSPLPASSFPPSASLLPSGEPVPLPPSVAGHLVETVVWTGLFLFALCRPYPSWTWKKSQKVDRERPPPQKKKKTLRFSKKGYQKQERLGPTWAGLESQKVEKKPRFVFTQQKKSRDVKDILHALFPHATLPPHGPGKKAKKVDRDRPTQKKNQRFSKKGRSFSLRPF